MHRVALKACVMIAGASVVAAATHANVDHAGGYGSPDAPLIIALAVLLTIGMGFVGLVWGAGHRASAVLLGICILSGEAYWVLTNAEREVARRELREAPSREARDARMKAEQRVADALVGVAAATAAVTSEAAKKDCLRNCAALLTAAQTTAQTELTAARDALSDTPLVSSGSPLPDRLGIASWLWDLIMAGLRSLAVVGGSLAIGMCWRADRSRPVIVARPSPVAAAPSRAPKSVVSRSRHANREHVASFLRSTLKPDPVGQTSLRALHRMYNEWSNGSGLSAAELGKELRSVIDALELRCEPSGRDVIVYGAAVSGNGSVCAARVSEKIETWNRNAASRCCVDPAKAQRSLRSLQNELRI